MEGKKQFPVDLLNGGNTTELCAQYRAFAFRAKETRSFSLLIASVITRLAILWIIEFRFLRVRRAWLLKDFLDQIGFGDFVDFGRRWRFLKWNMITLWEFKL